MSMDMNGRLPGVKWLVVLIGAAVISLPACEAVNGGIRHPTQPDMIDGEVIAWPFRPVEMRIHPLTRMATEREGSASAIEARIEFLDADRHTTRALGKLTLSLHRGPGRGEASLIDVWVTDLNDLSENAMRFDDVTRTYLLPLQVDPNEVPAGAELHANFQSADGRELTADFVVKAR
jgi:hypothetical protein